MQSDTIYKKIKNKIDRLVKCQEKYKKMKRCGGQVDNTDLG